MKETIVNTETMPIQNTTAFESCSCGDLVMLKDVIAGRMKISAEDYIELVKALNRPAG